MQPFRIAKPIVGMIHIPALPGAPRHTGSIKEIIALATNEARVLTAAGCDGLLIENMHDVPYLCGAVGPEIVAAMTAAGVAVRQTSQLPLGVQILAAANREALAVAHACGAQFVRVENFAYAHVADEGLMPTADAGPLLRYRRQIGAEEIHIFADVKKKHASHAITADVSIGEAARTAEFFGADALIVTGPATAQAAAIEDVTAVRKAVTVPVCIGSGLTPENLPQFWAHADIFIVGSCLKVDGLWSNAIDEHRLHRFLDVARSLRKAN
jgi:uncharacterized protein